MNPSSTIVLVSLLLLLPPLSRPQDVWRRQTLEAEAASAGRESKAGSAESGGGRNSSDRV